MKKLRKTTSMLLIFALLIGTCSCAGNAAKEEVCDITVQGASETAPSDATLIEADITYPEVTTHEGVTYGVSATVTKITPTGLTLNYYRETADEALGELFTDGWYALEYCAGEDGPWLIWEQLPLSSTAEAIDLRDISISAQNKTVLTLDWTVLYGALDPGAYRLVKILYERTSEGELYGKYDYLPFRIPEKPFAGYGLTLADVPAEKMPSSKPVVNSDFRMTAEDVTPRGATLRFSQEIGGGYDYYLERYNGETWESVPYLPLNAIEFAVPAVAIFMRETRSVGWTRLYGELEPGVYRIAKDMGSWEYNADYYAYFEITE